MYYLTRRERTDPADVLSREFDRMLGRYFGESEIPDALAPYAVDVREDADRFYVEAELPGFTTKDIELTLENGVLTISAHRQEETKNKKGEPLHTERRWTHFQRSFTLPTAVKDDSVKAELTNGVLTITLDKREEVKPRKIQVLGGDGNRAQWVEGQPKK